MTFGFITEDIKISSKKLVAVTILFSCTLAYFYLIYVYIIDQMFLDFGNDWLLIGNLLFYSSIVFSAIIGSFASERISRRKFLWSWLAFGVVTTAALAFFRGLEFSLLSSVFVGVSFGLGFPSCVAFLADSTTIEERGRVSGIVLLLTFVILFLAILGSSFLELGFIELVFLCLSLKVISFLPLFVDPCERNMAKQKSWMTILSSKNFSSYLFPWLMFSIAYGLSLIVGAGLPKTLEFESAYSIGRVLQYFTSGIFAFIAGVMADRFGRKLPIIIGMVMLGASYAFVGLATSPLSWVIFLIFEGIAWGTLMVALALTAFGDLASPGSKEKVFVLATILPLMTHVGFSSLTGLFYVPANILSTVLSIVLFVSVIPILRATETFPEAKMRERKLKEHIKEVGKIMQESEESGKK